MYFWLNFWDKRQEDIPMTQFYQLTATDIHGNQQKFEQFRNKIVLIVNTASRCGFTPQYAELQALYEQYQAQGLEIIGFPCNQFGHQEPDNEAKIQEFCQINYGVSFLMMAKIDVNGENTHQVYQFLKSQQHGKGLFGNAIKWNFTKFLIDSSGNVVGRYAPTVKPAEIAQDIDRLLAKNG